MLISEKVLRKLVRYLIVEAQPDDSEMAAAIDDEDEDLDIILKDRSKKEITKLYFEKSKLLQASIKKVSEEFKAKEDQFSQDVRNKIPNMLIHVYV